MDPPGDVYAPIGGLIDRIKCSLKETLAHLDSSSSDPSTSPLLHLSLSSYEQESNTPTTYTQNPATWSAGLVDVGNLLVDLAIRYQEQTALLKTSHTSALLKHQVETRRIQEKLAQDQKMLISQTEAREALRAENAVLQEQLRREQLSSASKMDLLHQKIGLLEESLHTSEEKLKTSLTEQTMFKAHAATSAGDSSGLTSRSSTNSLASDAKATEDTVSHEEGSVEALERELRIANDLLRKQHEKLEKSELEHKKAIGDVERLKAHLITIQSDIDEKEMTLQEEIERLTAERDELKANGASNDAAAVGASSSALTEDQINEYETSLENAQVRIGELEEELETTNSRFEAEISMLEASLIQMRADQQTEVELHTVSLQGQVSGLKEHIARTEAALTKAESVLAEKEKMLLEYAEVDLTLAEERSKREAVEFENENLKTALNDAASRLSMAAEGRDAMVAKPLVAKIFCTYLNPATSGSSKAELLHLMANILELTDDERRPLNIPLIKPADAPAGFTVATPARGLVSMISSATGSVISGSVSKGKQWLTWGRAANQNPQPAPLPTANGSTAPTPSLSDIWVKILLEGSEAKPQSPTVQPEQPRDVFKVPALPLASTSSAPPTTQTISSSGSFAAPKIPTYAAPTAVGPQTPISNHQQRLPAYQPVPRPEPSQSPYLAQQQAMRSQFMPKPTPTPPPGPLTAENVNPTR